MPRRPNAFKPPLGKPALLRPIDNLPPLGRETATTDDEIRGRLEMLLAVDDSLGRILRLLEKLGALDNTVVVLASDHGYFYGEHGLGAERRLAYEETIRIPLIVRYPPLARAGATPRELVMSIDVAPTFLAVAGLTPSARIQGRSLVPILQGSAGSWRSSILIEYFTDTVYPRIRNMGYTGVRTDRYKYIEYRELKEMDELYDLEADPYEQHNLVGIPAARATRDRMRAELRRLMTEASSRIARYSGDLPVGRDKRRKAPYVATPLISFR
jgi:N-acetylglucosamine-6-sulfatase